MSTDLSPNVPSSRSANAPRRPSYHGEPHVSLALARGATLKEAAKSGGVSTKTVRRRLADPEYQARVSQQRSEFTQRAIGLLAHATTQAVDSLIGLLEARSEMARLGAAKAILDYTISLTENQETQRRITILEEMIYQRTDTVQVTRSVVTGG